MKKKLSLLVVLALLVVSPVVAAEDYRFLAMGGTGYIAADVATEIFKELGETSNPALFGVATAGLGSLLLFAVDNGKPDNAGPFFLGAWTFGILHVKF